MAKNKTKQVKSLTHEQKKRLNIPTLEMESLLGKDEAKPEKIRYNRRNNPHKNPELYERNMDLDPQLVWQGKDKEDEHPLDVNAVPIYVQEKIHPQAIIEELRRHAAKNKQENIIPNLFADYEGELDLEAKLEFYAHAMRWTNRMILGDSLLVMNSLANKEDLRSKVQCIYLDPPYGINFNSNWQPSTKGGGGNKKSDISREPEQIKAFRDTWKNGINSYLSYLRDRLTVARELLTETGSIFVQIGDENVHRMGAMMDEVFGAENRVTTITYSSTGGSSATSLPDVANYILWYAKDKQQVKYRQIYESLSRTEIIDYFGWGATVELPDGTQRKLTDEERFDPDKYLPKGTQIYRGIPIHSQHWSTTGRSEPYEYGGRIFHCGKNRQWSVSKEGMDRLAKLGRLDGKQSLSWKIYEDEVAGRKINNLWARQMSPSDKRYVVETAPITIQRCILMTTDPGDLVLDPTCGSGTTAYVAEQFGRRWITCDTSRVALTLARARLMGSLYPYYFLQDSQEGAEKEAALRQHTLPPASHYGNDVSQGFVYRRVPYVSAATLAYDEQRDPVYLYDQPYEQGSVLRVTGPFTMESLSPHRILPTDDDPTILEELENEAIQQGRKPPKSSRPKSIEREETDFRDVVFEQLLIAGIKNGDKNARLTFDELTTASQGEYIHFEGKTQIGNTIKRVAICIGPEYGTVTKSLLLQATREAADFAYDQLIVLGFAFEGYADEGIMNLGTIPVQRAHMNNDLHMADRLKSNKNDNLFILFGEPDIELDDLKDGTIQVTIKGIDIFDPNTGNLKSSSADKDEIACWFIDTDYNGEAFFVRHAYFLGAKDPYKKLKTVLKSEINQEAWNELHTNISRPFPKPTTNKIAVKAINHFGEEVLKVFKVS